MVAYTTIADLERLTREASNQNLQAGLIRSRARSPRDATFLSHSAKDKGYVPILVHILESHGATVYIDDKDPELLEASGRRVAEILRERIRACRKFIVFATQNIEGSRWVPWELGMSDGHKGTHNTAIFPAVQQSYDTQWTKQEYLGAYDRIVWGCISPSKTPGWIVWNQESNTALPLRDWLAS